MSTAEVPDAGALAVVVPVAVSVVVPEVVVGVVVAGEGAVDGGGSVWVVVVGAGAVVAGAVVVGGAVVGVTVVGGGSVVGGSDTAVVLVVGPLEGGTWFGRWCDFAAGADIMAHRMVPTTAPTAVAATRALRLEDRQSMVRPWASSRMSKLSR